MDKWNCAVFKQPEKLTVGEKFSISCQGLKPVVFDKNIAIIFPQKKDNYRLYVLRSLQKASNSLELKVVSYRTGVFDIPFIITDGNNRISAEGLSFTVDSVLEGKQEAPHPPFGPWTSPWPIWHWSLLGATLFLFLTACFLFGRRFLKRRNFIKRVKIRQGIDSHGKIFARNLRKKEVTSPNYVKNLDRFFRTFLEDQLGIPALGCSSLSIVKSLKKYNKAVYTSHRRRIEVLLNEIREFKDKKTDEDICRELRENCLQLVFDLEGRDK